MAVIGGWPYVVVAIGGGVIEFKKEEGRGFFFGP